MKHFEESAAAIEAVHDEPLPTTALVLGSGLGRFGENLDSAATIPYEDIPRFPVSTVAGHHGRLLIGAADGVPVVCMQGRMHYYEGYPADALALPIRTLHHLGVRTLVVTNAAGGINPGLGPGTLMVIDDHINLTGRNPLIGPNDDDLGLRFPDMSCVYDTGLRALLDQAARAESIDLAHGVYLQTTGPSFETPAEIRMMRGLGADAVGMSTVPECLVARHLGMRVAGLSVITNVAAGLVSGHVLTHEETMAEAAKAYDNTRRLLLAFLARVHA